MEKNFDLREVPIEDVFEAISKDPTADVNILFHENAAKALRDLADDIDSGRKEVVAARIRLTPDELPNWNYEIRVIEV